MRPVIGIFADIGRRLSRNRDTSYRLEMDIKRTKNTKSTTFALCVEVLINISREQQQNKSLEDGFRKVTHNYSMVHLSRIKTKLRFVVIEI